MCESPSNAQYKRGCRCEACRTVLRLRMRAFYRAKGANLNRKPEGERARRMRLKAAGYKREWTPKRKAAYEARYAITRWGTDAETIVNSEIFDRDGWICGICQEPVDPKLKFPDRWSASLDHIRPLSKGGSHTQANVRCSHLTCNIVKRDRIEVA